MHELIKNYSLYLVISEEFALGRRALQIAKAAISGGADIIQLREKHKPRQEVLELARKLCELCRKKRVTFIVNDDPLIAKESNADGVHLGQEDLKQYSIAQTRKILGKGRIIGVSTHSPAEFKLANNEPDIDYIAFGPVFPTKTKDYFLGTKDVRKVLAIAKKPVVFIGGINLSNLNQLLKLGVQNIAAIRGIVTAKDIKASVRKYKKCLSG